MSATGGPSDDRPVLQRLVGVPVRPAGAEPPAADVDGMDWSGAGCHVPVASSGRWWLLLFLGASCDGCGPFWAVAADPAALGLGSADGLLVVTRAAPREDLAAVRTLLPSAAPNGCVVLSDTAWRSYRVQGPPFFALVAAGRVVTEGVPWSVESVAADVRRARDRRTAEPSPAPE